jgi:peroxin-1
VAVQTVYQLAMQHIDPFRSMHIGNLFASAAASACADRPIVCVFTSSTSPGLHAVIQSSHLADQAVVLNAPSKASRKEIIASLIEKKTAGSLLQPSVDFAAVSAMTDGYLPADLRDLVDRAIHNALTRRDSGKVSRLRNSGAHADTAQPLELTEDNFTAAQKDFTPISLQSIKLQYSDTRWADIGGLRDTRRVLRETLEWPTKYARIFANCPLRLRSG